jgi:UDP-GlcNAc:undecaprenyl-phosphate GlcNAc-1-phosphate transferase
MNLIDGLDGLAAGTATLASLGFLFVALEVGDPTVAVMALCLIASLVAFLRFDFHPARIFMGDTGSMFLGFALAAQACVLSHQVGFWTALFGSAAILGLPILDTASAIWRRIAARRHIFAADDEHTHHRLMRAGLSHRGAVLVLYGLETVFVVLGCGVLLGHGAWFAVAVAFGLVAAVSIARLSRRGVPAMALAADGTPELRPFAPVRDPRVRTGARRPRAPEAVPADVLADLPPAAAGGGPP